jgi:hypothetical protein
VVGRSASRGKLFEGKEKRGRALGVVSNRSEIGAMRIAKKLEVSKQAKVEREI